MLKRLFEYAPNQKWHHKLSLLFLLLSTVAWASSFIIGYKIIEGFLTETNSVLNSMQYSIYLIATILVYAVFKTEGLRHSHIFAYASLAEIRKDLAKKLVDNPLGTTLGEPAGSYRQKIVDSVESMEILLAHAYPEGLPYLFNSLAIIVLIFVADFRLGLLALLPVIIGVFVMGFVFRTFSEKIVKYNEVSKDMSANIVEYISGIEVIKIFNEEKSAYKKLAESVSNYRNFTLDWFKSTWLANSFVNSMMPTISIFVIPFGIVLMIQGKLSLLKLVYVSMLCFAAQIPLSNIQLLFPIMTKIKEQLNDLDKDFKAVELKTGKEKIDAENKAIRYENVDFSYDEKKVIKNVSFEIEPRQKVALVGESGSGKSTLAKLLMHYYDLDSGKIFIGDKSLEEVSLDSLMDEISYVSQDNFLFDISIRENIAIGKVGASEEEIINASKAANIHDFIMSLPKAYDTNAGDSGNKLSGGEKQRICIARAMIKDAPILILDEATSYTDPENEFLINSAIKALAESKTVITIAHKLSSVKDSDLILLIDEGEIRASGTHEELLDNEIYKALWNRHQIADSFEFKIKEAI
ncbi:MAG: ABC transporter ATP-binding protein [Tissierellia bacterium]|nr:ABC transporter ATP-binding protein [Tissierellia bacterium]